MDLFWVELFLYLPLHIRCHFVRTIRSTTSDVDRYGMHLIYMTLSVHGQILFGIYGLDLFNSTEIWDVANSISGIMLNNLFEFCSEVLTIQVLLVFTSEY